MDYRFLSRAITLFCIGAALTLAMNLLQVQRIERPSWVLVPCAATAATLVGLVYPSLSTEKVGNTPDGSQVMRCVAVFVGIYQASAKIDFSSYLELLGTLTALAVGMWWLFDRSKEGFLLSSVITMVMTAGTHLLVHLHVIRSIDPAFLYSRLWCIFFSGSIAFGTIGRRLAAGD